MNLIPKIRPGEEISIEKLNALIDKINCIEISKKELEAIRDEIRTDIEQHNTILEGIKASQGVIQQVANSDSLETITTLLQQFISANTKPSPEVTQRLGMTASSDGGVEIYLEENGTKTASFILSQGANGEQGPQGIQGRTGDPGPRGEIGPRGFRGVTGKQGVGASVNADYVSSVEDLSLVPNDLQQYLRIQIKSIDSEGVETLKRTCYIPTQGYIYVPEIYQDEDSSGNAWYVRFKKTVNTDSTASGLLDGSWRVTGPQGLPGSKGATGAPGTGLTCSNLIRLTDAQIFNINASSYGALETLLLNATTAAAQNDIIANIMSGVSTQDMLFGLIPIDKPTTVGAKKFTFVEKTNTGWQLLRQATFPMSDTESINVYTCNAAEPKTENMISSAISFEGTTYYKLIVGASFIHVPDDEADLTTYLYTVYNRARLDTLTSDKSTDSSYYILVKNSVNAGVEVPNLNTDNFYAHNIFLPTNEEGKGSISAKTIAAETVTVEDIEADNIILPSTGNNKGNISAKTVTASNVAATNVNATNVNATSIKASTIRPNNILTPTHDARTRLSDTGWYYIYAKQGTNSYYSFGLIFWEKNTFIDLPNHIQDISGYCVQGYIGSDGYIRCGSYYMNSDEYMGLTQEIDSEDIFWCKISSLN